ncbi:high affinity copper transporter [Apiosordaria backusii]|uniref:Copper transport protein n=1 Tax=Apiosordaria backusii TaxID=314023 RepID=A0AA40BND7_9PEZI|nr:high affinity copper transporter [Apiosordaria backusii]
MDHSNHDMSGGMDMTPSSTVASVIAATTSTAAAAAGGVGHGMGGGTGCKISMLWNWNTIDSCFIASSWKITSVSMFAGSCIGVLLLTASLEFLRRVVKEYDRFLFKRYQNSVQGNDGVDLTLGYRPTIWEQMVRALLHMVQFGVGYLVMLLAMYYNGYLILCILIGAYFGSLLFHWEPISAKA